MASRRYVEACYDFSVGRCTRGDSCRYSHDRVVPIRGKRFLCYECGEEGHFGRDCPIRRAHTVVSADKCLEEDSPPPRRRFPSYDSYDSGNYRSSRRYDDDYRRHRYRRRDDDYYTGSRSSRRGYEDDYRRRRSPSYDSRERSRERENRRESPKDDYRTSPHRAQFRDEQNIHNSHPQEPKPIAANSHPQENKPMPPAEEGEERKSNNAPEEKFEHPEK